MCVAHGVAHGCSWVLMGAHGCSCAHGDIHLSEPSPHLRLPKMKIMLATFRIFDFFCFLLYALVCIQRLVQRESPDLPDSSSFLL